MVTDGVLEAVEEDALLKFISELDAEDAQDCAEAVVGWAQGLDGRQPKGGGRARGKPAPRQSADLPKSGSAAVAASRIAGLVRADPEPTTPRDDMTVVVIKVEHEDGVKV